MTAGFDVCLHNKRLNMLVVNNTSSTPEQENTDTGSKVKETLPVHKHKLAMLNLCTTYYKHLLVLLHFGMLFKYLHPFQLGRVVHYAALIMSPCVSFLSDNAVLQFQALVLHLAAVFAVTFHTSDTSMSLALYGAALIILASQFYSKKRHTLCQMYITIGAGISVISTIILQQISGFEHMHSLLDFSVLCITVLVFICNETL